MRKTIIFKLTVAIVLAVGINSYAAIGTQNNDTGTDAKELYQLGEKLAQIEDFEAQVVNGNEISNEILESKADAICDSVTGSNREDVIENLQKNTSEDLALYLKACDAGVVVTEEEVEQQITYIKENMSETSKKELGAILKGYGISEDEYWNKAYDEYKKNIIIQKYLNEIINNDIESYGITYDMGAVYKTDGTAIQESERESIDTQIEQIIEDEVNESIDEYNITIK